MTRRLLEICVDHSDDVTVATDAGADRIELCASLPVGGLTPGQDLLARARDLTDLPIMVMIRPRGGDFVYGDGEVRAMEAAIDHAKESGADGVVLGCLTSEGDLDIATLTNLVTRARPLPVTFHRAFDEARQPFAILDAIIDLGVDRLLTSGQAPTAPEGTDLIRLLVEHAGDRLVVMPGCGLRAANVRTVADATRAIELHGSASSRGRTQAKEVAAMRRALDAADPDSP